MNKVKKYTCKSSRKIMQLALVLVLITAFLLPATTTLADSSGLIAHWNFDEGSGSTAHDSTAYHNHGNINGASWTDGGILNKALMFNDTDQVAVPDSASLDYPNVSGKLTIAMWAKKSADVTGWQPMLLKWGCYALEITADQKLRGTIWDNFHVDSTTVLSNSVWYHLAVTFDGTTMRVYVNGQERGSGTTTNHWIHADTWPLHMGYSYYSSAAFPGCLDDVYMYSSVLTETEINALYLEGMQVRPDDWRGYWTFDESDGPIADDVSGYLNNGNIDGAVLVQDGVGTSLLFNPQSENTVWVADSTSLDKPHQTNQLTIEMWAKKTADVTGDRHILMKWGSYYLQIKPDQKLQGCIWGKDLEGNTVLANNVWYHLAATYDGFYIRLYVNGVLDNYVYNPGSIPQDTWPLQIGHTWYDAGAFPGYLDEVRVYDYALTQDRIGRHYAAERPPAAYDSNHGGTIWSFVNGYAASSLSYDGSAWDGAYARWYHHFKLAGVGATRWKSNGNPYDRITSASMDAKITNNPGGLIVVSSGSIPNYIGSIPESSGPTPDYTWARAVTSYAVDTISIAFPPLAFAWTTTQVIFDLTSKSDGQIDTTTEQKRMWDYGWESDAGQFLYFEVSAPNNVSWAFSTTYKMGYLDGVPNNFYTRDVTLGPYVYNQNWILPMRTLDGKGLNGESWNPGMMTDEEKAKYGIEEIPIELLLKEESGRFVLPREDLQQMLDSGESVVYFAHNLPINLVPLKIDADGDSGNITPAPTAGTLTAPTPATVTTTGTVTAPTPTPLHTPEPAKEPNPILVPAPTPTPTYVPSPVYRN